MLEEKPKELNLEDPSRLALMTLLTWGTRCSFFLCLTGLVVMTWTAPPVSVGNYLLLATVNLPVGRLQAQLSFLQV